MLISFILVALFCLAKVATSEERCSVILRRTNGGLVNFDRPWQDYVRGFGYELGDYWLGLEKLYVLTKKASSLRIRMTHLHHEYVAKYGTFWIDPETDDYRLHIAAFDASASTGGVGDAMYLHNGALFSTKDHDANSEHACPARSASGWWFTSDDSTGSCGTSNLCGKWRDVVGDVDISAPKKSEQGIRWNPLTGPYGSLAFVVMELCQDISDGFPDMTHASYQTVLTTTTFKGAFRNIPYDPDFEYAISPRDGIDVTRKLQIWEDGGSVVPGNGTKRSAHESILASGWYGHRAGAFPQGSLYRIIESDPDKESFSAFFAFSLSDLVDDPGVSLIYSGKQSDKRYLEIYKFTLNLQSAKPSNQPQGLVHWRTHNPNRRDNVFSIYKSLKNEFETIYTEFSDCYANDVPTVVLTVSYNSSYELSFLEQTNPTLYTKSIIDYVQGDVASVRMTFVPSRSHPYDDRNLFEGDMLVKFMLSPCEEVFQARHTFRFRHSTFDLLPLIQLPSDFRLFEDKDLTTPVGGTISSTLSEFFAVLSNSKLTDDNGDSEIRDVQISVEAIDLGGAVHRWDLIQGVDYFELETHKESAVHYITYRLTNIWKDKFFQKILFVVDYEVVYVNTPSDSSNDDEDSGFFASPAGMIMTSGVKKQVKVATLVTDHLTTPRNPPGLPGKKTSPIPNPKTTRTIASYMGVSALAIAGTCCVASIAMLCLVLGCCLFKKCRLARVKAKQGQHRMKLSEKLLGPGGGRDSYSIA